MILYEPGRDDAAVVALWIRMNASNDLDRVFPDGSRSLSDLFEILRPPMRAFFEVDDYGPWFAAWSKPEMSGATFGLWIAPERRHRRSTTFLVVDLLDALLKEHPVLFSITKQENLLPAHRKLGYEIHGPIPYLFDNANAWVVSLTREGLRRAQCRYKKKAPSSERPESEREARPPRPSRNSSPLPEQSSPKPATRPAGSPDPESLHSDS
jgi:hypothetical protein